MQVILRSVANIKHKSILSTISATVMRVCVLVIIVWCLIYSMTAELICTGVLVGSVLAAGGFLSSFNVLKCRWYECCDKAWIIDDLQGLGRSFAQRLYGQHLVMDTVVDAIHGHLSVKHPSKALVLSFHGWTGCGKNYVSQMIAENLYKNGMRSNHAHLFLSSLLFMHSSETETYKVMLQEWIRSNVSNCERSLFIFDEVEKMPLGVMDAIKPFIDYHRGPLNGVDYRKSIFIFLSNTGGHDIYEYAHSHWKAGKEREDISLADMEAVIHKAAFNEEGGLRFSQLIAHHLIDHFIPFLPMERTHVKLCIRDSLRSMFHHEGTEEQLEEIAGMIQYFPPKPQLYSSSGCKRIEQKIQLWGRRQKFSFVPSFREDL